MLATAQAVPPIPSIPARPAAVPEPTGAGAKPFVKWIGGKRQLLPRLLPVLLEAPRSAAYHEPFVGGGAVFFALRDRGWATKARLSDVNRELIESYVAIRDQVDDVITSLSRHARLSSKEHFYEVRQQQPRALPHVAARLIFLNKTCFNGLYRVNNSGGFNSPWGRHKNPLICDEVNLRAVSAALEAVSLEVSPFQAVLDHARPGHLVYFDPPYVPVSATSSFTEYSAGGFGSQEQAALASAFRELDRRNVRVVLSNSDTPMVRSLYSGFKIDSVLARRNVNTRADRRGPVGEVIVRNF